MPSNLAWLPAVAFLLLAPASGTASGDSWSRDAAALPPPSPRTSLNLELVTGGMVVGLGAAALLSRNWEDASGLARAMEGTPFDPAVDVANEYGGGLFMGSAAAALYLGGWIADDSGTRSLGKDLAVSLGLAWTTVWVLKVSVDAQRPSGGRYSFPSGHTATAFAAAPVIAEHLGANAGVVAYALASLTGVARVEDDAHYMRDVFAGAAIGILAGRVSLRLGSSRLSVTPVPNGAALGLTF